MKKVVLITLILFMTANSVAAGAGQSDPMTNLADFIVENGLEVDQWQVTLREEMSHSHAKKILAQFRNKNSYLVSGEADANTIKYSIRHVQKTEDISEQYNVIIPKDGKYKAQFIAVFHSKVWSKSIGKAYMNRVKTVQNDFFSNESTKFTCVQTSFSDKMKGVYVLNDLKRTLNLQHLKRQKDSVKNSTVEKIIYGYTPLWSQKIDLGDRLMNFQMAVKKGVNGDTELTIGTPILINEY